VALASIISVAGSAYRGPGTRMLITATGDTVGTISGGCLEHDVVEHALQVMNSGTDKVVTYDTRGSEDAIWGLGLGCSGVVRILIENLIDGHAAITALKFAEDCLAAQTEGVVATIIDQRNNEIGHRRYFFPQYLLAGRLDKFGSSLEREAYVQSQVAAQNRSSFNLLIEDHELFVDFIQPPRSLLIFGAEHDAVPLVTFSKAAGCHVTVVDIKSRAASRERFAHADAVVLTRPDKFTNDVQLSDGLSVVVMTHNYLADLELLKVLLPLRLRYLGVLGPKARTENIINEIRQQAVIEQDQISRLHSPIGIDIGASTPEEVAISIVAELRAIDNSRPAGFLSDRLGPIHDRTPLKVEPRDLEESVLVSTPVHELCGLG